jgi:hypothetical protein
MSACLELLGWYCFPATKPRQALSGLHPREPCGFLKPDHVEEGGGRLAYVHQRGRQALQQEQMVVQFFEKHDWIARCKVGSFAGLGSRNPDFAAIESQKLIKGGQKGAF